MSRKVVIALFFFLTGFIRIGAQSLTIWIDPKPGMTGCVYTAKARQTWILTGDSVPEMVASLNAGESVQLKYLSGNVQLLRNGVSVGYWPELILWAADSTGHFTLTPEGLKKTIEYYDHLKVIPWKNQLRLFNIVWMEHYICGVVAAEGGLYKTPEFLKVQAICSRTYAIRNRGKFAREGFDLTDKVDCQVYHGIPKNLPGVEDAVKATAGVIAVDEFDEPIDAVFSANCGGQSANSEEVWTAPSAYLRSTESYDQYREFRNSSWTYTCSRYDLLNLFTKYYKTPVYQWQIVPDASGRVRQLILNQNAKLVMSGTELRSLLKLKSTKFRMYEDRQQLFFVGQGFGHGVGMCQDGAYKLSTLGWANDAILRHFYQGVQMVSLKEWRLRQLKLNTSVIEAPEAGVLPEPTPTEN